MITEQQVKDIIEEKISNTDLFVVEVTVSASNKICVFVDRDNGRIAINDCADISRHIESKLNRDIEDFELEVSSPGMDRPLKLVRQYSKHVGRQVNVLKKDGVRISGKLANANEQEIVVETKTKEKVEGKKSRQLIVEEVKLPYNEIKETKLIISFN